MKNLITYFSKFAPDNGSGMHRLWTDNGLMKSRKLFAVLTLLLFVGVGNAWGAILYNDNFGNVGSNSNSYTTRTGWTLSNTYAHYNSGIRLGTNGGYATKSGMSSISGTKDIQVTVYVAKWNNDESSLVVTVNGTARIDGSTSKTFSSIVKTTSTGGAVTWNSSYLISFIVTGATSLTTIKFGTNASGSRAILGPIRISDPAEDCGVFYESWDKCTGTGGNDGSWSGSIASSTLTADNTGWTVANGNGASKCAKFGTGANKGSAQTPAITYTGSNNLVLTFKAGAWNGGTEGTTLNLSATNATLDKSSVTLTKGAWTTYTVNITSITSGFKIKWEANNASNNRFFLDDICISEKIISCEVPTVATKGTFNRSTQVMPINWTSAAGKVDVCYSTSSTTPAATPSASYTVVSNQTSSPVNLNVSNKDAGNYYCWVRSVCDAESKSGWVAITGSYFTIPSHTLTVTATPASSGTFTKSPNVTSVVEGRTVSITASPAAGYNFSSWAVSGTNATLSSTTTNPTTFTMGTANATVTATFTAKPLVSISLSPASGTVYVGQYADFTVAYDPSDYLSKGYTLVATPTYVTKIAQAPAQTLLRLQGGRSSGPGASITTDQTETISIQASGDNTKTTSVSITVKPLPKVHFVDIVHGYAFDDVVGTIEDNALVSNKTTPTHDAYSGVGANTCETEHTRLVGWVEKTWADEHPNATKETMEAADSGIYFTAGATINVLTYNGNTYYAVWAMLQ